MDKYAYAHTPRHSSTYIPTSIHTPMGGVHANSHPQGIDPHINTHKHKYKGGRGREREREGARFCIPCNSNKELRQS